MAAEYIHLLETGKEIKARLNSGGSFDDRPICGHGSFHAKTTNVRAAVTCPECIKKMES